MIHTWFQCKIRYDKTVESGMTKKVSELYLVDALSFTEAEARIIEEMSPFVSGEMQVSAIARANYSEFFASDSPEDDIWYKVKASWITLDEKSGKEKKSAWYALVESNSTANAEAHFRDRMQGTLGDYTIESVSETQIIDVYPYVLEKETDENR